MVKIARIPVPESSDVPDIRQAGYPARPMSGIMPDIQPDI